MIVKLAPGLRLHRYRVSGLVLTSALRLPELARAHDQAVTEEPAILVHLAEEGQRFPVVSDWFMTMTMPSGEPWLSCGAVTTGTRSTSGDGYLLRFPELADFLVDARGREITCQAWSGTEPETLRHLLLNQVLPLILNLRGRDALHATAILTPDGVCAFAGQAGAGKSTLAASFLLAGYPVIGDDCLLLDERDTRVVAIPAYPGIRLWEDALAALYGAREGFPTVTHYAVKRRLLLPKQSKRFPTVPLPLARIYCLEGPIAEQENDAIPSPSIRHLSRRDAFMHLLTCLFRFDIRDRAMLTRQFHFLDRLVAQVPVRQLFVPRNFSSLPAVREAILTDLRTG